ncbi:MAG: hypothetical protein WDZ61_01040 [Parcubacteria group bacterium]
MRRYLSTLHKKPDHHKKRFAFLTSASFTLAIFAVWSLVNFGLPDTSGEVAVNNTDKSERNLTLEPVKNGVAAAFKAIGGTYNDAKQGLEQVDFEGEYEDMRGRAYESYGR